ncbi:MAG TPA: FUSC family protein [Xanthobacteraceae bacterium]|nr:FUSC family protein [Xanthobacteraceae bacterium]
MDGPTLEALNRRSLSTTAGVLGAVLIALAAGLEQPYWAAMSALVIANADRSAQFTKGVLRIAGTGLGVVGGYGLALWLEGQPVAQALALMLAAGFGTYGRQRSPHGYAWFYAALSVILVLSCSMTTPEQLYAFAHFRCYEIMAGVVAATVADWALGPRAGEFPTGVLALPAAASADDAARESLAAAVGTLAVALAWAMFDFPVLTQVLVSSLVIVDANIAATGRRGRQRILGCIIGGSAALAAMAAGSENMAWWLLTLGLGTFAFARIHLGGTPDAYVGTQAGIAFVITLVDSGPPASIEPALNRLIGIMIGVAIMSTVVWATSAALTAAAPAHPEETT